MLENLEKFKNFTSLIVISVLFLILGLIFLMNFLGGIGVSKDRLIKALSNFEVKNVEIQDVSLKIGLKQDFLVRNFALDEGDFKIKVAELEFKKSFFNSRVSEIDLINGEITLYSTEEEPIAETLSRIRSFFFKSAKPGEGLEAINFKNIDIIVIKKISGTSIKLSAFSGKILNIEKKMEVLGSFKLGFEDFSINSAFQGNDFDFRLESPNVSFKGSLVNNKGKVMLGVNNLSKFLNELMPDAFNVDLGKFDSKKNALYFESDLVYNDVKKVFDLFNSKLQLLGTKEQSVLIESLSDNSYKISLNLEEIEFTENPETLEKPELKDISTPPIPLSVLFPNIKALVMAKVGSVRLNSGENITKIDNFDLNLNLGYGIFQGSLKFIFNEAITFNLEGDLRNYENSTRKGAFKGSVLGKGVDFSNFIVRDVKYLGEKNTNFDLGFDLIISGEAVIFDNIAFNIKDFQILPSKLEFNVYDRQNNYLLDLKVKNLDFSKIKFQQLKHFTKPNTDLFRILFDYLKFKKLTSIALSCSECKIDGEIYDVGFKSSITTGTLEVGDLSITGKNLSANISTLLDIRDSQNGLFNFNINIEKAQDLEISQILKISNIFEGVEEFRLPSFESFSGAVNVNINNFSNKFNKIDNLNALFSLNAGVFKIASSSMLLNGLKNDDFLKMEVNATSSMPEVTASLSVNGFEVGQALVAILQKKDFKDVAGLVSLGIGLKTYGFLFKDLKKNANMNLALKSENIKIQNFNIEALSQTLQNKALSFKQLSNVQVQNKILSPSNFAGSANIKFVNSEFVFESLELKTPTSTSIFVGKFILLPESKYSLQLVGKTAVAGANLNNRLNGVMPVYFTSAIKNEGEEILLNIDYSQINKYSETRRVLYR